MSATASTSSTDGRQGSRPGRGLRRVVAAGPRWRVDDGKVGASIGATLELGGEPRRRDREHDRDRSGPPVAPPGRGLLAAASARQHRMMQAAYCLIAPTLPVVRRNHAGYVVDARDKVVTERGAPTRRATHRRAVQTGDREANPEADRYPWLADRDLILLGYRFVAATPGERRNQRRRVHEAAVALRDRGALDFEAEYRTPKHGGRTELVALRLLPSAEHAAAHAARWAARKHDRNTPLLRPPPLPPGVGLSFCRDATWRLAVAVYGG